VNDATGIRSNIPWAEPTMWGNEQDYLLEAVRSTWISGGPFVERFERSFRERVGSRYAIAVSNGTAALQLSYLALGLKAGDEIVVPGFGFMAAANVALQLGIRPVFCDVDPLTWCLRASDVEAVLTPRTRAVVAIHSYGNCCDMADLAQLAERAGMVVIEDAAEALGSRISGRYAGTIAPIGTYSFHATKTITTGEGGMVVTDDDDIADKLRLYSSHGLRRRRHYWHEVPGNNFRLTNLQAAMGCAQLEHFETVSTLRRHIYYGYAQRLSHIPGIRLQTISPGCDPLIWAIAMELDDDAFPKDRDQVIAQLLACGIETRPGFQPPNEMSYFEPTSLPTSERLGRTVISLPSSPKITDNEIEHICGKLDEITQR
jgi:perosamine synthetase